MRKVDRRNSDIRTLNEITLHAYFSNIVFSTDRGSEILNTVSVIVVIFLFPPALLYIPT